jgi:hypothetical protein
MSTTTPCLLCDQQHPDGRTRYAAMVGEHAWEPGWDAPRKPLQPAAAPAAPDETGWPRLQPGGGDVLPQSRPAPEPVTEERAWTPGDGHPLPPALIEPLRRRFLDSIRPTRKA